MKVIIWYNEDINNGRKEMERVVDTFKRFQIEVETERHTKRDSVIKFKNGDYIKVIPAVESQRGQKCNISYVERSIDQKYFDMIIRACTIAPPIQGFNLYGQGDLRI